MMTNNALETAIADAKANQKTNIQHLEEIHRQQMKVTAEELKKQLPGMRTPSAKMLEQMQVFARNWRKRHPLKNEEQLKRAVEVHFNIRIVEQPAPNNE